MNKDLNRLLEIANKSECRIIGLMSGTSLDGLDSAHITTYIQNGEPVVIDGDAVLVDLDLQASYRDSNLSSGLSSTASITAIDASIFTGDTNSSWTDVVC